MTNPSPGEWHTPAGFAAFEDRTLSFRLGATQFEISQARFHIHAPDSITRPHAHPGYQLLYYRKGSGEQLVGEATYRVGPQTIFFVPPHTIHRFRPDAPVVAEAFTLIFAIDLDDTRIGEEDQPYRQLARLLFDNRFDCIRLMEGEVQRAESLLSQLHEELTLRRFGYDMAAKAQILLLLRLFLQAGIREESDEKPLHRTQWVFLRATAFVRRNLGEALSLAEVAGFCDVSSSYLQKIFKQNLGKGFCRYVQETRIDHAAHLLRSTDLPVKAIARECGIPDRHYFTRVFRKLVGTTPRAYRQSP